MKKIFDLVDNLEQVEANVESYNVLALEELNTMSNDIDANMSMLDNANNVIIALEEKKEQLSSMLTDDVNLDTLKMGMEHVNFMYGILGIPQIDISVESYDTIDERKLAVEGIGDTLKKAGKAVKDTIVKIIKKIIAFFSKIWDFLTGKEKEADAMDKKIESTNKKTLETLQKASAAISTIKTDVVSKANTAIKNGDKAMDDADKALDDAQKVLDTITDKDVKVTASEVETAVVKFRRDLAAQLPQAVMVYVDINKIQDGVENRFESSMDSADTLIDLVTKMVNIKKGEKIDLSPVIEKIRKKINSTLRLDEINRTFLEVDRDDKLKIGTYPYKLDKAAIDKNLADITLPTTPLKNYGKGAKDYQKKISRITKQLKMIQDNPEMADGNEAQLGVVLNALMVIPKVVNKYLTLRLIWTRYIKSIKK